jgi:hypothetical protein
MLVSSANRIGIAFLCMPAGKSFEYKRNSVGPSTDPWVNPCLIIAQFVAAVLWFILLFIRTRWYLSYMHD